MCAHSKQSLIANVLLDNDVLECVDSNKIVQVARKFKVRVFGVWHTQLFAARHCQDAARTVGRQWLDRLELVRHSHIEALRLKAVVGTLLVLGWLKRLEKSVLDVARSAFVANSRRPLMWQRTVQHKEVLVGDLDAIQHSRIVTKLCTRKARQGGSRYFFLLFKIN